MMTIYPDTLYTDLEFDQILELAASYTRGPIARRRILNSVPYRKFSLWEEELNRVHDLTQWKREGVTHKPAEYEDILPILDKVKIANYSLDIEEVLKIRYVLDEVVALRKWSGQKELLDSSLYIHFTSRIAPEIDRLKQDLDRLFYPDGNIREDASPDLKRLFKRLGSQEKNISAAFQQVMQKYRSRNLLTEPFESYKNGKQVLCVAAENKRNVKGLIQDESGTGQTVYIEPDEMSPLYHVMAEVKSDIRQEINRLIQSVSADIRRLKFEIQEGFLILSGYDVWNAKAELALLIEGQLPGLREVPHLDWKQAYHPLLKIQHERVGKKVVPFDLTLDKSQPLMMVSGPNAGGKSVLLKAVAINQLMLQSGFLIPVDPGSVSGMFQGFFADIGDQQSLEEDLSTYSSHLLNMKVFLDRADHKSLVFMDELGGGTDPQYGGAISESILKRLTDRGVWGVVTTHYFNLKMFADKHPRIGNAAMSFDKKNLEPTYRFIPGKPGSSFAFEIARKSGLPNKVIQYARNKAGKNKWAIEEMLVNLENEKNELRKKEKELQNTRKQLDQMMKNNKVLSDELTYQRKKWKKNKKLESHNRKESDRKWLREKIRELEDKEALAQARKLEADMQEEKKELASEIDQLDQNLTRMEKIPKDFFKTLKVGDFVKYKEGDITGKITSVQKNKVELQVGGIRMNVKKKDVRPGKEPLPVQKGKSIGTDLRKKKTEVQHKIDIRGYSMMEAEKELQNFLDEATIANVSELRILHGKGSGVLRTLVKDKLREYNHVREVSHPPREQGGDGVTLVKF